MDTSTFSSLQATDQLESMVGPILCAPAFERLGGISFLGILSPRFATISKSPIYRRPKLKKVKVEPDGSRADHSIGVANIAVAICKQLKLSYEQQKYAAAWGLLHDLGNWPLSHTGQHAFSELLSVKTKTIREWLITNDKRAPKKYFVANELRACGIDPDRLLGLFRKSPDKELEPVSNLFQSRLTPDMIEGVWRSGRAFGIHKFHPIYLIESMYFDVAGDIVIKDEYHGRAVAFWKVKREIYSRFFSSKSVTEFESRWSQAVFMHFQKSPPTLMDSLELNEFSLVEKISAMVKEVSSKEGHRWKPPVHQRLERKIPKTLALRVLDKTFIEESIKVKV